MAKQGTEIELVTEEQMMLTHMIETLNEAAQIFEDDYAFKAKIKEKISQLVDLL